MIRVLLPALCLLSSVATAQLPQIRITGVFPPGAQQGTSADLTITAGTDLDEIAGLVFSHPGLTAVPKVDGNGQSVTNQFQVTVAPDVPPGLYDVRARGLFGISNPRIFRVDTLAEAVEAEPNNTAEQAQVLTVPSVVNARSNAAADVDVYTIPVQSGQTIVLRTEAATIDSVMQPVLELFDDSGRRVAHARRRRQKDAAVVYTADRDQQMRLTVHDTVYGGSNDYFYRLVVDHRSLIDFVRPQVLPAGVATEVQVFGRHLVDGESVGRQLHGSDLFRKTISITLPGAAASVGVDSTTTSVDTVIQSVDGNLLTFATTPEGLAHTVESAAEGENAESGDQPPTTVAVPGVISGSFERELDDDRYRFQAKKGQKIDIDVLAQRLGSNADPLLFVEQVVTADDGTESLKRMAREDNGTQNPGGAVLPTLTADPQASVTIPEDGWYQIRLKDHYAASQGADDLTYSVVLRPLQPDFRLVVFESLPSTDGKAAPGQAGVSLRKGGTYEIPVYAYRAGGHNDPITIQVDNLPPGVVAAPVVLPAGRNSAVVVLTAGQDASEDFRLSEIVGVSGDGDQTIKRRAKVASLVHDSMNGLSRTARVSSALAVGVMKDEEPFVVVPKLTQADVHQDQQLLIPISLIKRTGFDNKVDLAISGQPGNTDVSAAAIEKGQASSLLRLYFKENAATGPATLLIHGTGQVSYRRNPWLVERAEAKVAAAVAALAERKKELDQTNAKIAAGMKALTLLQTMLKTSETEVATAETAEKQRVAELTASLQGVAENSQQLTSLRESLAAVEKQSTAGPAELDQALASVETASADLKKASSPLVELAKRVQKSRAAVLQQRQTVAGLKKQVAEHKAKMTQQQATVDELRKQVTVAEANLKAREAEKTAAEAAVKKAQDATKPQNKNLRTVAVPVNLHVYPAAGKLTAAVPDGGVLKKGATVQVRVTVVRKNNFAGPVTVSLVLPDGVQSVTSDAVTIAADQTEGVVTLTVAGDAPAGAVAHAVMRAEAADFNGRPARFDAPVQLKVSE